MKIDTNLQALLSEAIGRPVADGENVVREDEPAWNSLVHMEFVFMIEDEYGIRFEADELAELSSLAAIAERVEALRAG